MMYPPPTQARSRSSERKFLIAFDDLLRVNGYENTSIDDIADRAGLTRDAFLKRFGSKEQAAIVLFARYCDQVMSVMNDFQAQLPQHTDLHLVLREMSQQFEAVLQMHLAANRAMNEHFHKRLEVHELTKKIFKAAVELMRAVQLRFLDVSHYTEAGAWNATQILVTVSYNYLLRAMPALPEDHGKRHKLIADLLEVALKR